MRERRQLSNLGKSRCNCRARHRRTSDSWASFARTRTFSGSRYRSNKFAATWAPMYPVEPVRKIATLLRLSLSFRRQPGWQAKAENCAMAELPAAGPQSEDRSSGGARSEERRVGKECRAGRGGGDARNRRETYMKGTG